MRRIRFVAAAAVFLAMAFGPAQPSGALTLHAGAGGMSGVQVYLNANVPLAPAAMAYVIEVSGPVVVVNQLNVPTVENLQCQWPGNGLEGYAVAIDNEAGGCQSASLNLVCNIVHARVGLWMVLEGQCNSTATGTLQFTGVWEWVALPDAQVATVGGYFALTPTP